MRAALFAAAISFAVPGAADEFVLGLPIDCQLGETCHIQHLVDRDATADVSDFQCGTLTYDGHKGTDFALPTLADMQRGVDVLAAAPGTVAGLRDGMADVAYDPANPDAIRDRECGNGVLLRHTDGWETQYCHLKFGSIAVQKGARVEQGAVLGQVGLSGKSTFPHVHLSVRHHDAVIDPFAADPDAACGEQAAVLWTTPPPYLPGGLIQVGFADAIPSFAAIKEGRANKPSLPPDAAALVLYAFAFGGLAGDQILLQITGPQGNILSQDIELTKNQPQLFRAAGKRLRLQSWPAGLYTGTARMSRNGRELGMRQIQLTIE